MSSRTRSRSAPKWAARSSTVAVREGQTVKPGDLLFRIDPEPFRLQVAASRRADRGRAGQRHRAAELVRPVRRRHCRRARGYRVCPGDARPPAGAVEPRLHHQGRLRGRPARRRRRRASDCARPRRARQRRSARLAHGRRRYPAKTRRSRPRKAQRAVAELNLRRTEVRAPMAGRVAQADRLQVGQQIIQGVPVLTLVADREHLCRGQLQGNRPGRDEGRAAAPKSASTPIPTWLKGHVASIGAGTGSEFSVLPAQNATGNWVKVTQRVPVRIAIDETTAAPDDRRSFDRRDGLHRRPQALAAMATAAAHRRGAAAAS